MSGMLLVGAARSAMSPGEIKATKLTPLSRVYNQNYEIFYTVSLVVSPHHSPTPLTRQI